MLKSFEAMGTGQLLAMEGQHQISLALADWLKSVLRRTIAQLMRQAPGPLIP